MHPRGSAASAVVESGGSGGSTEESGGSWPGLATRNKKLAACIGCIWIIVYRVGSGSDAGWE